MIKKLTARELLSLNLSGLPSTKRGLCALANREKWSYEDEVISGGLSRRFILPTYVVEKIQSSDLLALVAKADETQPAALQVKPAPVVSAFGVTERQTKVEGARFGVLKAIEILQTELNLNLSQAIKRFLNDAQTNAEFKAMLVAAKDGRGLGDPNALPDERTLQRWASAKKSGVLAPKVRQQSSQLPIWAEEFLSYYRRPQKPSVTWAWEMLCQNWSYPTKKPSQSTVRFFLKKLGNVEVQRGRLGDRELLNLMPFVRRDISYLLPTDIYTADGHAFDAEVAHPFHGRPFRPEITTIADVATRKIVGFSIDLAESSLAVLAALTNACTTNGIPNFFYVDNGSGYKNAMLSDTATGLLGRLGTTITHSLPYNAKAKGVIERLHRSVWVRAAKELDTYIGKDMDAQAKQGVFKITRNELKKAFGKRSLLSFERFLEFAKQHVEAYNNRPHSTLPEITDVSGTRRHMSPSECWDMHVEQEASILIPDEGLVNFLFRPQVQRTVNRGELNLMNNRYFSRDLTELHGETVNVGYDIHDASKVWVYSLSGRLICIAEFEANKHAYFPVSLIEQKRDERQQSRLKRAEEKIHEINAERNGIGAITMVNPTINIGGKVIGMDELDQAGEAARLSLQELQTAQTIEPVHETFNNADTNEDVDMFDVPDSPDERFELYCSIKDEVGLVGRAAVWVQSYPKTAEFRAMSRRQEAHG